MLQRASAVILGHRFAKMVVLGGTNDVLLGIDPDVTVKNLEAIAFAAQQSGVEPILCEIPPIFHGIRPRDAKDYSYEVRLLNAQIARLAASRGWRLVDYYDPLLGHPHFSSDGVHMKRSGYLMMELVLLRTVPDA
jgi:lysophospholipase L1-like esterase